MERTPWLRWTAGCGQAFYTPGERAVADWERLITSEQRKLAELIAAGSTPACSRCGRFDYDFRRMIDEQLDAPCNCCESYSGGLQTTAGNQHPRGMRIEWLAHRNRVLPH
jgi:hypothetical protein